MFDDIKELPSVVRMIISAVLKSSGVKPEDFINHFGQLQNYVVGSIQNFDKRISKIEENQQVNNDLLKCLLNQEDTQNGRYTPTEFRQTAKSIGIDSAERQPCDDDNG